MKKERIEVATSKLLLNTGQLEWLPSNPRQWTKDDLEKTKASIERDPDFLEDRPILVVVFEDKFVVFGGNLRTSAAKEIKRKTMPAMLYTPETDTDRETIKRRAILDNGSFGAWDFDMLANEWDNLPLTDWGVPVWKTEKIDINGLFDEEKEQERKDNADIQIIVSVPVGYKDNEEDIRKAIEVTLEQWQGCKLK